MAVHATVEKHRTPGLGEFLRALEADAVIVASGDDGGGVGQALQDHAAETLRAGAGGGFPAVAVAGGDEEYAGNLLHRLGLFKRPLHHQRRACAVRHEDDGSGRLVHVFGQFRGPHVIHRMIPVRLRDADEIGEGLFPVRLPVIRSGAVEAGVYQDGKVVECSHGAVILSVAFACVPEHLEYI